MGALLRTADGFGVEHVYLTGISPYPETQNDTRLPHISKKLTQQINKTALGAIDTIAWSHHDNVKDLLFNLKTSGFRIIGLEQSKISTPLNEYSPPKKCVLLLGTEVTGISQDLLHQCDDVVEITMYGRKESFNVAQASAIALYALRET